MACHTVATEAVVAQADGLHAIDDGRVAAVEHEAVHGVAVGGLDQSSCAGVGGSEIEGEGPGTAVRSPDGVLRG